MPSGNSGDSMGMGSGGMTGTPSGVSVNEYGNNEGSPIDIGDPNLSDTDFWMAVATDKATQQAY